MATGLITCLPLNFNANLDHSEGRAVPLIDSIDSPFLAMSDMVPIFDHAHCRALPFLTHSVLKGYWLFSIQETSSKYQCPETGLYCLFSFKSGQQSLFTPTRL